LRVPIEQEVRHEKVALRRLLLERYRQVGHVEILPRHLNLGAELAFGEPQHVPRQLVGCVPLLRPKRIGSRLLRQAAALVLLAAAAGARVISTDLCAHVKSHDVVTLSRGIPENKSHQSSFTERMESSVHSSRKEVSPCSSNSLLGTGTAHTPRKGCRSWRTECRRADRLGRLQTLSWLLREVAKRVDLLGGRSLAVDAWMSVAEHGICNEGTAKSSPHRVRGLGWCRNARTQDVVLKSEGTRDALEQIAAKRTRSSPDDWTRPWCKR
jgi:hypothetical protein